MKKTIVLEDNEKDILIASQALKSGKTVVFPTETVYGLGANGLWEESVKSIYNAKGRPSDNPLILHIADISWVKKLTKREPYQLKSLINNFWPGPLTLVLEANTSMIPKVTLGGLDTVAIRMPGHPLALKLLGYCDLPIAAPSANSSGRPSPTTSDHVIEDLMGKVDFIINGGKTPIGIESTVVDLTGEKAKILRPGSVTFEELKEVIEIEQFTEENFGPVLSPGVKYRHYQPKAPMQVFLGNEEMVIDKINETLVGLKRVNKKVGILSFQENIHCFSEADYITSMGHGKDLQSVANTLYSALRSFDSQDVDIILSQGLQRPQGIGIAISNRLNKACGNNIIIC